MAYALVTLDWPELLSAMWWVAGWWLKLSLVASAVLWLLVWGRRNG